MSSEHKRPLYAFALVALICALCVGNGLRSDAVVGLLRAVEVPRVAVLDRLGPDDASATKTPVPAVEPDTSAATEPASVAEPATGASKVRQKASTMPAATVVKAPRDDTDASRSETGRRKHDEGKDEAHGKRQSRDRGRPPGHHRGDDDRAERDDRREDRHDRDDRSDRSDRNDDRDDRHDRDDDDRHDRSDRDDDDRHDRAHRGDSDVSKTAKSHRGSSRSHPRGGQHHGRGH